MTIGWVAYGTVLGAAFGLAALITERAVVAARRSSRAAWCASMVASVGVPISVLVLPSSILGPAASILPSFPITGTTEAVNLPDTPSFPARLDAALPYAWGLVSTLLFLWLAWSAHRLRHSRRGTRTRRVCDVDVVESGSMGPAVIGVFRSWIAIPGWLTELDDDLQRLAVLHEREHQRRRDPLLLWAAWLGCAAVPWNPALWWQLGRLRVAIEMDCDRRVLAGGVSRSRYGELLLEVGRRITRRPRIAVALFETRTSLERRIHAMLPPSPHRKTQAFIAATVVALVVIFAGVLPSPARPKSYASRAQGEAGGGPAMIAEFVPGISKAARDTPPAFRFTPYTVKPRCIDGCDVGRLMAFLREANAPATCQMIVGILIGTDGHVEATDPLQSSYPACEEGARAWAMTTRWSPAENDGDTVSVWIAQPIRVDQE